MQKDLNVDIRKYYQIGFKIKNQYQILDMTEITFFVVIVTVIIKY